MYTMLIDKTFYVSDFISIISVVLIIVGGIFTYYQWRNSMKLKRSEYINQLNEKMSLDEDMQEVVYLLDYSDKWYDQKFHGGGNLELKIDKTLSYFSYICYLRKEKLISNKEFGFFEYRITRILLNSQIQDYFYNLYHFSNKFNVPFTFMALFEYGRSKKLFDKEFYDPNSHLTKFKYHHYINF